MTPVSSPPAVLVASAEPEVRRWFTEFLSRGGWTYALVESLWPAIAERPEGSFDIIVTDLTVPGIETLSLASPEAGNQPARVVILMPEGRHDDAVDLLRERGAHFIKRPLSDGAVERALAKLLRTCRQGAFERALYRYVSEEAVTLILNSREAAAVTVPLPVVEHLYDAGRIDLVTRRRIELAFHEALTNSVEHGNLELRSEWREEIDNEGIDRYTKIKEERLADPKYASREVTIVTRLEANRLLIAIRDSGQGFLSEMGNTAMPDAASCHGRGMRIIAGSMDEVSYHNNGRELVMVKFL